MSISDRKAGIALNDSLAQHRPLARFPERCRVDDPVAKRTAIATIAARDRAWNADELGPHFIAGEPHRRIAVTAHIHECQVRGKFRILPDALHVVARGPSTTPDTSRPRPPAPAIAAAMLRNRGGCRRLLHA